MNADKARELLDKQALPDARERRAARIARLSGVARKAATALAEDPAFLFYADPERTSARLLEPLADTDRLAVFEALQPKLGRYLDRMWRVGAGWPYQSGSARRAFRAPRDRSITLSTRHGRVTQVIAAVRDHEPDAAWVARWAPYLAIEYLGDSLGAMLAMAIDEGGPVGDEVFDILVASAEGEDEIGAMGRHVTRALLMSGREDGWAFMERLLLAAQRQEGLRQAILESVDESHPGAFRRMVRVIIDNDLFRFPSVIRAIDVWFEFQWASGTGRGINDVLERVLRFLDDPLMREAALRSGSAEDVFLALWSMGYEDVLGAVPVASGLISDSDVGRRYAAVHFLVMTGVPAAVQPLADALADDDLRVVARAFDAFTAQHHRRPTDGAPTDMFERLERLVDRLPGAKTALEPIVWPWTARTLDRDEVGGSLMAYLGDRDPSRLVAHLTRMEAGARAGVAIKLSTIKRPTPAVRQALISLAGDPSAMVRGNVIHAVTSMQVDDGEAIELEDLLRRKAGDLRRAVVGMLMSRGAEKALLSADRLLASRDAQQRLAGLEILRRLVEGGKSIAAARERARTYRDTGGRTATEAETTQLRAILGEEPARAETDDAPAAVEPEASGAERSPLSAVPTLVDGLGLLNHANRTVPERLRFRNVAFTSDASFRILAAVDELVHEHRGETVTVETWAGEEQQPLGEVARMFPVPPGGPRNMSANAAPVPREPASIAPDLERSRERLPLHDVWVEWARSRGPELRDADGLELLRARYTPVIPPPNQWAPEPSSWDIAVDEILGGGREPIKLRYHHVTAMLVDWLAVLEGPAGMPGYLLDTVEDLLMRIPADAPLDGDQRDWRNPKPGWRDEGSPWLVTLRGARVMRRMRPDLWSADDHRRLWLIERWIDEGRRSDLGPAAGAAAVWGADAARPAERSAVGSLVDKFRKGKVILQAVTRPGRKTPPQEELIAAFRTGAATEDDVIDDLIGPGAGASSGPWARFRPLSVLSARKPPPFAAGDGRLAAIVERVRQRIVDVELRRGEAPTEASTAALSLTYSGGLDTVIRLVRALGTEPFVRGWSYDGESRQVVFSRLIRATMPGPEDSPTAFATASSAARIPEKRLVELGCFAPQWADHVEAAVGWPGLASAIWWMHAHTKDPSWTVSGEIREAWTASIAERTPLDAPDLVEGAVDVAWFTSVFEQLGPTRWKALDAAAKYGSTGGGHTRAQLFANAMRGAASEESIVGRLTEKRHQDSARALGLVPLPEEPARDEAVLRRYRILQEFVRTSRQFGSARQASEKRAAEIGLANLARTAGYADPIRLGWAMEARGVADLSDGPLTASAGDVEVSLSIDDRGEPDLRVTKAGTEIKAVPAQARKFKEVGALRQRSTDLRRQASRMRRSLEEAMIRGDAFSGAELVDLAKHPLLAPQLRRLVLLGDGIAGYPIADGRALVDHAGTEQAVGASESLRLAHPMDLLDAGPDAWHEWQRDAFRREIVQPFKQVFRELYPATQQEVTDGTFSRRYAGHQVGPRQALALLGGRGWVSKPDEGVRRTFHHLRLSAELWFQEGFYSPAEIDGLTLEAVRFTRSTGSREPVAIADVPPRVFSEVMRDLDLVVSVAHAGGVDPEASASTVEMRATLVTETSRLLDLPNVRIDGPRAVVDGSLAEYSVHLGSAIIHLRPGGSLFIVPVQAQNRGRLFLPFVDDDPKTAEVLSKVLLLARDREIKDPSILAQIRRA